MTEITNVKEYNWAVARVEQILKRLDAMECFTPESPTTMVAEEAVPYNSHSGSAKFVNETSLSTKEELEIELKLLSDLVSDYSDKHFDVGMPKLSEVIQLRMYERGLSQKAVAELIGVSPARVCEYLSGKTEPTLQIAREICHKLDIDPSIVIGA